VRRGCGPRPIARAPLEEPRGAKRAREKRGKTRAVLTRSPAFPRRRDGGRLLQPEEDRRHLRGHMRRRGEATLQICPSLFRRVELELDRLVREGSPIPGAACRFLFPACVPRFGWLKSHATSFDRSDCSYPHRYFANLASSGVDWVVVRFACIASINCFCRSYHLPRCWRGGIRW
jgi:hypothetical protein